MAFSLLATRRRKILLAILVLLGLLLGPYLTSRLRNPFRQIRLRENAAAQATTTEPETLRVLTYNIAHGRGPTATGNWEGTAEEKRARIGEIAELLIEIDADVVVLNEVDFSATWSGQQNQAEALARTAGYPFWVEQRNLDFRLLYGSWKFGNAILSRYPIASTQPLTYPPYATWEDWLAGSKQGVIATLDLPGQQQAAGGGQFTSTPAASSCGSKGP